MADTSISLARWPTLRRKHWCLRWARWGAPTTLLAPVAVTMTSASARREGERSELVRQPAKRAGMMRPGTAQTCECGH
eukprot:740445-Rhodomonas_salina.2